MAKATATTGSDGQVLHTRTTGDSTESQVVVIGTDGSDSVLDPATLATQATLASILAKIIAAPATEATLASVLASVDGLEALIGATNTALAATLAQRMVPLTAASPVAVSSSASSVTLAASNASRRALLVFNDSTAVLYLKYGSSATSSSYTVKLAAGDFYEMPLPVYTGIVTGIWASANGNALVTEGT